MLDDHTHFRSYPFRLLGFGFALSPAIQYSDLSNICFLVGIGYVGARVINKGLVSSSPLRDMLDTFVFEGLATIVIPSALVSGCIMVTEELLNSDEYQTFQSVSALLLGGALVGALYPKVDEAVDWVMNETIRGAY